MKNSPKNILITGCSSGIGLCCAQGLQQRGHRVFATARKTADIEKLSALGLEALKLDVNDSQSIKDAVQKICEKTDGKIDVLFNNCGYAQAGAVEDLTRDAMRQQFETNVFGPLELTTLVMQHMRANGTGRIIQNGSLLGYVTMPYRGAYNASKFALEGLTDTLRQELRNTPIRVSLIAPGPIHSKIRENAKHRFVRHVNSEQSIHQPIYRHLMDQFFKINGKTAFYLPPSAVLKKVIHAVESRKPRARYYVGMPSYLFMLLKRTLPTNALDFIMHQVTKGETKSA